MRLHAGEIDGLTEELARLRAANRKLTRALVAVLIVGSVEWLVFVLYVHWG